MKGGCLICIIFSTKKEIRYHFLVVKRVPHIYQASVLTWVWSNILFQYFFFAHMLAFNNTHIFVKFRGHGHTNPDYLNLLVSAFNHIRFHVCYFSGGIPVAFCDAGIVADEGYNPNLRNAYENLHQEPSQYGTKEYHVELKPLFSAFGLKSLGITSLWFFLLFYLPLLEPCPPLEDDADFTQESPEEKPVDLVVPFKNSIKQIFREVNFSAFPPPSFTFQLSKWNEVSTSTVTLKYIKFMFFYC